MCKITKSFPSKSSKMVIKAQETDGMIAKDVLSCSRSCKLTGYETVFEALKHAFSPIIRAGKCD